MQIPETMTEEQINNAKNQLGDITNKIVIHFSKKGVGVDTSETGCSKKQLLMGALSLLSLLGKEDFTNYISVLDDGEKLIGMIKVLNDLNNKKEGKTDGVQ